MEKHVVLGWWIGLELEYCRCYKVFFTETRSERIFDVVIFFPQNLRIPRVLSADAGTLAAQDLVEEL